MDGFFEEKDVQSLSRPNGKSYSCISCGLYKTAKTPRLKPFGNFKKKIIILGSAPGKIDDEIGKPFQGKEGRYLKSLLRKNGISLEDDCLSFFACHCIASCDSKICEPTANNLTSCRKRTLSVIKENKPKLIIILGFAGLYSLLDHRWVKDKLGSINRWRGWNIPDQDFNAWICPTFDISRVMEKVQRNLFAIETVFEQDIKQALSMLNKPFPVYKKPKIKYITDLSVLDKIKKDSMCAFDYETTGLKPHKKEHEIICASIAISKKKVYTFFLPKDKKKLKPFINFLKREDIRKVAQNMKYEDTWSKVKLNTLVKNWYWDTLLATHILDNRSKITSLKFQTYVQFGIVDYDSEINPYLMSTEAKNANSLNNIKKLLKKPKGKYKLLTYCALDSAFEYRLAVIQLKKFENLLPF